MTEEELADTYDDIVGVAEIALTLRVPLSRVKRWIERARDTRVPPPVKVLSCGRLYRMSDWRGWYALWRVTRSPRRSEPD